MDEENTSSLPEGALVSVRHRGTEYRAEHTGALWSMTAGYGATEGEALAALLRRLGGKVSELHKQWAAASRNYSDLERFILEQESKNG